MNNSDVLVRKTANYRIWVDETGVGRIRVLKRINFKTLVSLFEELHEDKSIILDKVNDIENVFKYIFQ